MNIGHTVDGIIMYIPFKSILRQVDVYDDLIFGTHIPFLSSLAPLSFLIKKKILLPKTVKFIGLNLLILSVPDEFNSRNTL